MLSDKSFCLIALSLWMLVLLCHTPNGRVEAVPRQVVVGSSVPTFLFSDDEPDLPPFTVRPFSEGYFTWSMTNVSNDWILSGTFNFTNGEWVAVGLMSPKKMLGPVVLCYINTTGQVATCFDFIGSSYDISQNDALPPYQQANTTVVLSKDGFTMISFDRLVYSQQYNVSDIVVGGFGRMIFARGKWPASSTVPKQHESGDSNSFSINLMTGIVVKPESDSWMYVLIPGVISLAVICAVIHFIQDCLVARISTMIRTIVAGSLIAGYLIVLCAYVAVYYSDYLIMVAPKAFFRSCGQGAVFILGSMMLPTARRLFFSDFFGLPPERAITYHVIGAILLLVMSSIHGFGMWYQYGTAQTFRWKDKDNQSRIPGLIAYVLMLVQITMAMLRHRLPYTVFRKAHYLYIPIIFFICAHAPIADFAIIPTAALLLASHAYRRLMSSYGPLESLLQVSLDSETQTIVMYFSHYTKVRPCRYYFLRFPEYSRDSHPFAALKSMPRQDGVTVSKFVIKCNFPPDSAAGNRGPAWTAGLYAYLEEGKELSKYVLDGPYGILVHRPVRYGNYLLAAGGIGITSVASMLFQLAQAQVDVTGIAAKANVHLVWVAPSAAWLRLLGEDLLEAKNMVRTSMQGTHLTIDVYITNSKECKPATQERALEYNKHFNVVYGARPNWTEILNVFDHDTEKYVLEYTMPNGHVHSTKGMAVAYVSGPASFNASVAAACKSTKTTIDVNEFAYRI